MIQVHPGSILEFFNILLGLEWSLSDSHNQGRSVGKLTFANGTVVFYKPRDCRSDLHYLRLVTWLNERGADLRAAQVLAEDGYGWFENIEQKPCRTQKELREFYRNAGELLCLLYALRATDSHCENVIANGSCPVLIDTECLMHPDLPEILQAGDCTHLTFYEGMNASVFPTLFLPRPPAKTGRGEYEIDLNALGCVAQDNLKLPPIEVPNLWNINCDRMELELKMADDAKVPIQFKSKVVLNGEIQNFRNFGEELLSGFASMYRILLAHRNDLLAADSPLSGLKDAQVRPVIRPTMIYGLLLNYASKPALMQVPGKREEALSSYLNKVAMNSQIPAPIFRQELMSLCKNMEVPYFSMEASSNQLMSGCGTLTRSCYELMRQRIEFLSEADLAAQLKNIRSIL